MDIDHEIFLIGLAQRETGLSLPVNILLTVPRRYFFCGSFKLHLSFLLCFRALWSPVETGLISWLSFVMSNCVVVISHCYPGSGVVLDCIDS